MRAVSENKIRRNKIRRVLTLCSARQADIDGGPVKHALEPLPGPVHYLTFVDDDRTLIAAIGREFWRIPLSIS